MCSCVQSTVCCFQRLPAIGLTCESLSPILLESFIIFSVNLLSLGIYIHRLFILYSFSTYLAFYYVIFSLDYNYSP